MTTSSNSRIKPLVNCTTTGLPGGRKMRDTGIRVNMTQRGSGETLASGTYSAKWRNRGGAWMIEAEIFLTLA